MSDYYWGVLRITNPATLQKWKDSGKYQELINEGYIYAPGCGRFRTDKCTCHKCRKQINNDTKNTTTHQENAFDANELKK